MNSLKPGLVVLALIGATPLALAQTAVTPTPHSPQDNGAVKMGAPIAAAPDKERRDTTQNNEATNAPGMAGPVEGGRHAPANKPKPSITQGAGYSGGVQNPHLGTGNNGAPRNE